MKQKQITRLRGKYKNCLPSTALEILKQNNELTINEFEKILNFDKKQRPTLRRVFNNLVKNGDAKKKTTKRTIVVTRVTYYPVSEQDKIDLKNKQNREKGKLPLSS